MSILKKIGVITLMCALFLGLMPLKMVKASEVEEIELPAMFEVTSEAVMVYEYYNTSSKAVLALSKGKTGIAMEQMDWADGTEWYKIRYYYLGEEYVGYVMKSEVRLIQNPMIQLSPTPMPDSSGDASNMLDSMQGMIDMIGNVPQIILAVFSFLPAWCLGLVGVSFGFLVVMITIRIVRG